MCKMDTQAFFGNPIVLSIELIAIFILILIVVLVVVENGVVAWKVVAVAIIINIIATLSVVFVYETLRSSSLSAKYGKSSSPSMMLPPNLAELTQ
jgi:hypothetical protein